MSALLPRVGREAGHTSAFATRHLGYYLRGEAGVGAVRPLLTSGHVVTVETDCHLPPARDPWSGIGGVGGVLCPPGAPGFGVRCRAEAP